MAMEESNNKFHPQNYVQNNNNNNNNPQDHFDEYWPYQDQLDDHLFSFDKTLLELPPILDMDWLLLDDDDVVNFNNSVNSLPFHNNLENIWELLETDQIMLSAEKQLMIIPPPPLYHRDTAAVRNNNNNNNNNGRRRRKSSSSCNSVLELEEIQKHFEKPISEAAKEMNVGLTVLKKRCRQLNIMRWPHRKLKSLNSLIQNLKEMGLTNEIKGLEEHKRLVEELPDMDLTHTTKRLRQACFKANYKKKIRNILIT